MTETRLDVPSNISLCLKILFPIAFLIIKLACLRCLAVVDKSAYGTGRPMETFSDAGNDDAVERLLALAPGTVGIGTVRNVDVPVTISILEQKPVFDAEKFDQVVECSVALESGSIVAAGCTDYFPDAMRIKVPSGFYRVRASFEGLDSVSADGMEGNDQYHLQLWPAPMGPVEILKQRT